jgi:hypothetical protein
MNAPNGTSLESHAQHMQEKIDGPAPPAGLSADLNAALNSAMASESAQTAPGAPPVPQIDPKVVTAAVCAEIGVEIGKLVDQTVPEMRGRISHPQWAAFGSAVGETLAHYGITISPDAMHPIWKAAFAAVPIVMAAVAVRNLRAAAAANQPTPGSPPTPEPAAPADVSAPGALPTSNHPGVSIRSMDASQPAEPYNAAADPETKP